MWVGDFEEQKGTNGTEGRLHLVLDREEQVPEAHATWSSEGLMKYLADGEVDEIIIILPDNREIKMVRK